MAEFVGAWAPVLYVLPVLVVYLGEKIQQVMLTRVLRDALKQAQQAHPSAPIQPAPVQPPDTKPAPAPTPANPEPAPKATGPFDDYPKWFQWALHEVGFHEVGNNGGLDRYIALAHCGHNGDPWCAILINAALEVTGVPGSRSASSQSFRTHPDFVQLSGPAKGCIVVYERGAKGSGLGHVGFYVWENATHIWTLGGNEGDMVQNAALVKDSATFRLIGFYWPKSVPLPQIGAVPVPPGTPTSIKTAPAVLPIPKADGQDVQFGALVTGGYFSSAPFDKSIPASIRTNNPGALNVAPWIKSAPGYVGDKVTSMSGTSPNSTVIFSAPEYGVAAWFTLLQKYRAAGATTLSAIITRYGGGQDYSNYVTEVAAWSGLGEQAEISLDDDVTLLAFAKAMFRYEAGRPSPLSDAQILYGFNLGRGSDVASKAPTVT